MQELLVRIRALRVGPAAFAGAAQRIAHHLLGRSLRPRHLADRLLREDRRDALAGAAHRRDQAGRGGHEAAKLKHRVTHLVGGRLPGGPKLGVGLDHPGLAEAHRHRPQNVARLEEVRKEHLRLADPAGLVPPPPAVSLHEPDRDAAHAWGMAIDLSACHGCNGQTQVSGIGTYCWNDGAPGAGLGVCVDKMGVPTPLEPIRVDALSRVFATIFLFAALSRVNWAEAENARVSRRQSNRSDRRLCT